MHLSTAAILVKIDADFAEKPPNVQRDVLWATLYGVR